MFREAQWLAARLDQEFGRIIASVTEKKTNADVQRIAREYLKYKLERDMESRIVSPHRAIYNVSSAEAFSDDDLEWVGGELQTAKTELRERLYRHQEPLIDEIMQAHSVPPELRNALSHAILMANVDFWDTVHKRTKGDFSSDRGDPDFQGIPPNGVCAEPVSVGPLFSEVLPGFLDLMSQGEWRGQTLAQNTTTYSMFIECCGDQPVAKYARKDLAAFHDLLRALPRLYSKSAQWKGLSPVEIAKCTKEQDHERLAMKTVKRHFSALGRLFAYLKQRGECAGENPAYGFEFPDKRRTRDKRSMWDGEGLIQTNSIRTHPLLDFVCINGWSQSWFSCQDPGGTRKPYIAWSE
jgi:hypothetical protein